MTFAEWVSAYTAGYMAHRDGLDDSDGEAFLKAMHDDWQKSGTQRAKRGEAPPADVFECAPRPVERTTAYGHALLTTDESDKFISSSSRDCPACGEMMTQKENPTRGDSWWFTCPNKHATWIGK